MRFACFKCREIIEADDASTGETVDCPRCGQPLVVPARRQAPLPSPSSSRRPMPPARPGPAKPAAGAPLPSPRKKRGSRLPALLVLLLLLVGGTVGYTAFILHQPPSQTWQRLTGKASVTPAPSEPPTLPGSPASSESPEPTAITPPTLPEDSPSIPVAEATPALPATPVPPAAPPPSPPIAAAASTPPPVAAPTTADTPPPEPALPVPVAGPVPQGELPGDHTLVFEVGAPGVEKSIGTWGLDVTWPDGGNVRRGAISMGSENVGLVRVGFPITAALVNSDLPPEKKAEMDHMARTAKLAGNKAWTLSAATGGGVNPWFKNKNEVIPERWVQAMKAAIRYYRTIHGGKFVSTEPFNEPDYYGWQEGTPQNLREIMRRLRADPDFQGVDIAGPSTLNDDAAQPWYEQIKGFTTEGTTHILAGNCDSYVNFYRKVALNHQILTNPEVHNVAEVIVGAELGLQRAIWWGTAERARGGFIRAQKGGRRLAYADDHPRWTAAAVYRTAGGAVQAFLGGSERTGKDTTYRFECKDRPVFFDGDGPRRAYTVTIKPDTERLVNITWGPDAPPQIAGRYVLVNRASGKALEVADASMDNGARLQQAAYRHLPRQQWDLAPLAAPHGDQSYFTLRAAHSGKSPDDTDFSLDEGTAIHQFGAGENPVQHWYFEYVGDGYFLVRNRWSMKCLDVAEASSTADGAEIQQHSPTGKLNQQWRLVPVSDSPLDSVPPAAPAQLTASYQPGAVMLRWIANKEPDFAGYTVLRSSDGKTFDTVARGLSTNEFIDRTAEAPLRCRYVVRAVDRSLNQSVPSVVAVPTPGR